MGWSIVGTQRIVVDGGVEAEAERRRLSLFSVTLLSLWRVLKSSYKVIGNGLVAMEDRNEMHFVGRPDNIGGELENETLRLVFICFAQVDDMLG